jgi:RHS repeat-associated protein
MKTGFFSRFITTLAFALAACGSVWAQTNPLAESKRFTRGSSPEPKWQTFVLPLDSQKGVQLAPSGNNAAKFTDSPWFTRINKNQLTRPGYSAAMQGGSVVHLNGIDNTFPYNLTVPVENPLVAFGTAAGGTPLYVGQKYNFGLYGGIRSEGYTVGSGYPAASAGDQNNMANLSQVDLYVLVYKKSDFSGGATNIGVTTLGSSLASIGFQIPRRGTASWDSFVTNGYQVESASLAAAGFTFTVRLVESPGDASGSTTWGVKDGYYSPMILSVQATNPDYAFIIGSGGGFPITANNVTRWFPTTALLAPNGQNGFYIIPALNPLLALDFEARPAWRSTFIHQPQFNGEPMPASYTGKSAAELLTVGNRVTKQLGTVQASYSTVDDSPELRSHPILTKFVTDMGGDPIALANYVTNEIALTDGIAYNDNGNVAETSINAGGVNRGALATFLEGQGSPVEQCALLVHLLRTAGYPAVYAFPPRNELKMLDTRMSQLLRMQFKGLVNNKGEATAPTLIPVNYPWVAVSIPDPVPEEPARRKWVHVFPWLKDTEIKEGGNVYDYMPEGYKNGTQWLRKYLSRDTNILSLDSENDTLGNLFPLYVKNQLRQNFPGIAYDSLGIRARDRRNQFRDWSDFPQPWSLTETNGTVTVRENLSGLADIFDTVSVEMWSDRNTNGQWDSGEPRIQTGDMRALDVHNRRFYFRYQRTTGDNHNLILSLAPYRSGTTGTGSFGTSDPTWLNKQEASVPLNNTDYNIKLRTVHKRQRMLPANFNPGDAWANPFGVTGTREVTNTTSLVKGDMAAICLNFGRVSPRMLDVHLQEFWSEEKRLKDNPAATGDNDVFLGTTAYIMGMSYYEKVARGQAELMNLHRTNIVSTFAQGLAKLGARRNSDNTLINSGEVDLVYPVVDMSFNWLSYAGNRSARPDQGGAPIFGTTDFVALASGDVSAQEHLAINSFFKQFDAVSTVRLLHLAKQAGLNPIELTKANYAAQGEVSYTHNGTPKKLKDWAGAETWTNITAGFQSNAMWQDYQRVIITPGPISGANNTYRGVGAFVIYPEGFGAYITNNLNGGFGAPFSNNTFSTSNYASFNLSLGANYTPSISLSAPSVSSPAVFSSNIGFWNTSSTFSSISAGTSLVSSVQSSAWSQSASSLGFTPSGGSSSISASLFSYNLNTGSAGQPSYYGNMVSPVSQGVSDPVNAVTGEFYIDKVDLRLAGPMPLEVRRNYSSQNVANNDFGYGWKLAYFPYLVVGTNADVIHAAELDGSVIVYRKQSPALWQPVAADNPHLINVNGEAMGSTGNLFNAKIVKSTSGSDTFYDLTGPDGSMRRFKVRSFPTGGVNGVSRERPYLQRWTDNRGNYYDFTFNNDSSLASYGQLSRVQSSNGNFLGFYYDTFGHITEIYSGDGRRLYYRYDKFGDLIEVTLPDASTIQYDYERTTETIGGKAEVISKHLLVRETKPGGRILENVYDAQGRVSTQRATVGTNLVPVVNATFVYNHTTNADKTLTGHTLVTDAYGRQGRYDYTNSQLTKVTDPLAQEINQVWYTAADVANGVPGAYPRSLRQRTDKRGLVTTFKYDSRGNLIDAKATGDVTGDGVSDVVTTAYEYDPVRNLPTKITDALGNYTEIFYEDTNYPWLSTTVESRTPSALLSTLKRSYTQVTDTVGGATRSAYGLLQTETRAWGTADAASITYGYNGAGFVISRTQPTGTADPAVVTTFRPNLRGKILDTTDGLGRRIAQAYDDLGNRIVEERFDENGVRLSGRYDYFNSNGELEWADGPRRDPEDYVWRFYDGAGRLIEETQRRSVANAAATGVAAPVGDDLYATTFHRYDLFGNRVETRTARRNSIVMTHDALGRMLTRKHYDGYAEVSGAPLKASETWTYEPGDQIKTYLSPINGLTSYFYTADGKLRRQENPDGSVLEWRYYLDGRVQRQPVTPDTSWHITYDDPARTVTRTLKTSVGATLATTSQSMDRRGNVVASTDAEGHASSRTYDGLDRIKTVTGPASTLSAAQQTQTYTYDAAGKVTIVSNGLGETTVTTTDILGRTVSVEVFAVPVSPATVGERVRLTRYAYAADHHSVTVTEGSGPGAIVTTTYTDTQGNPVLTLNGEGEKIVSTYDPSGLLLTRKDELGRTTRQTYDALDRLRTRTLPDNAVVTLDYDSSGNLISRQMPGGLAWSSAYDASGRMQWQQLAGGGNTTRRFDYAYYLAGDGRVVGRLKTITDPRGFVATHAYDDFLRLQTVTTALSGVTKLTQSAVYDKLGQTTLTTRTPAAAADGPVVAVAQSYSGYGQLLTETVTVAGKPHASLAQTWDAAGRRASLHEAGAARPAPLFAFGHRADGRLTSVSAANQSLGFGYGDTGLLNSRANPWRSVAVNTRDLAGRPLTQTTTVVGTSVLAETLTWRDDGTLDGYAVTRGGAGAWNESRDYDYNSRGKLTVEGFAPAASTGSTASLGYIFDNNTAGVGVLTSAKVGTGAAANLWDWSATTVNPLARVTAESTNATRRIPASGLALGAERVNLRVDGVPVTGVVFPGWADNTGAWSADLVVGPGAHTLTIDAHHPSGKFVSSTTNAFTVGGTQAAISSGFDAAGNITSRTWADGRAQTLTWDAQGQLVKVALRDASNHGYDWSAVYDGMGRRLRTSRQQVVAGSPNGPPLVTTSVYDPEVEFLEIGVAVNGVKAWKVYGPDLDGSFGGLNGTGGLEAVVMDADGATKGVVSDTSGHVVATVATVGGTANWHTTRVGAYGPLPTSRAEVLLSADRVAEATAWRGRRADETGFYWLGARYYEPTSGRFLSPDPAGHAASMSLYDYANGDPVNQFDPDGRLSRGAWSFGQQEQIRQSLVESSLGAWQGQQIVQRENERFWNQTLAGQALRMVPGFSTLAAYQTSGGQAAFVDAGLNLAMLPLSFVGTGARVGVGSVGTMARVETQALVRTEVAAIGRAVQTESSAAIRSRVLANIAENQSATRNIGTGLATMESRASAAGNTLGKFSVGIYDDIRGTVSGLDAHHVGQKAVMGRLIPGYAPATAPSILVPKVGHTIRGPNGIVSRSTEGFTNPRDVIARDIMELRRVYPDVPNSKLQELIQMNKDLYPSVRK